MGKTQQVGRLVLVKLMVAPLSIRSLIILVFPVFHNRKNIVVGMKCRYVFLYMENKLDYLSSIVFHTVLVAKNMSKQAKPRNVATLLNRAKLEYLSSIVFHTVLVAGEYVKTSKTKKCGYIA